MVVPNWIAKLFEILGLRKSDDKILQESRQNVRNEIMKINTELDGLFEKIKLISKNISNLNKAAGECTSEVEKLDTNRRLSMYKEQLKGNVHNYNLMFEKLKQFQSIEHAKDIVIIGTRHPISDDEVRTLTGEVKYTQILEGEIKDSVDELNKTMYSGEESLLQESEASIEIKDQSSQSVAKETELMS